MGITLHHQAGASAWTAGSVSVDIGVLAGDLIVVFVSGLDSTTTCTGVTDDVGNSYTLRTVVIGGTSHIRVAYCISSGTNAANTVTATFTAGTSTKVIQVTSWTPDAGDTVTLDDGSTGSSAWTSSPLTTTVNDLNTTGTDELILAGFQATGDRTFSNQEIPSGTAATVLTSVIASLTHFYCILTGTLSNGEAETDVSAAAGFAADCVAFKSTAGGNYELTANPLTIGTPALDTPAISQVHSLTASALATGAPTLASPALNQNHAMTPQGLDLGAPSLGSPALTVNHVLTANALTMGVPGLGTPGLAQNHSLVAESLAIGTPTLASPALSQNHILTAQALDMGTPSLASPAITQIHALTASILTFGTPELGTPELTVYANHALEANPLTMGTPTLSTPAISQVHIFSASILTVGAPVLGTPTLSQLHILIAEGLLMGGPILGTPMLNPPPSETIPTISVPGLKTGVEAHLRRMVKSKDPSYFYKGPRDLIEKYQKLFKH